MIKFFFILILTSMVSASAEERNYARDLANLKRYLREFKLIAARETVIKLRRSMGDNEQWLKVRDIIHSYPQIGSDILLVYDKTSPFELNEMDLLIKKSDQLMLEKKFKEAAIGYQTVLEHITKNKKFASGRNRLLYWSLIHSLARTFYAMKQYDEAFTLYQTIPSSYPYYKQVQFELMWNNYMNGRLEYALGAIATMASGHFSKHLEPEVYLLQFYIYRRMCRNEEAEVVKEAVKFYHNQIAQNKLTMANWIKKDVETLIYEQILRSGGPKSEEFKRLWQFMKGRMERDVKRLKREFELVAAHIEIDRGKNRKLEPVKTLLTTDQLLSSSNEKWTIEDNEVWLDELGKKVFIQKDLCKK